MTKIIVKKESFGDSSIHIFHAKSEETYYPHSLLTIKNEKGTRTLRVSQWLHEDPVAFDKIRKEYKLIISKETFNLLVSKLRANYPEYFKDSLGLHMRIDFKGYDIPVKAIIPYNNNPIEFYKWWCLNQGLINMSLCEKIKLFDKVLMEDPKLLKREHKKMITK